MQPWQHEHGEKRACHEADGGALPNVHRSFPPGLCALSSPWSAPLSRLRGGQNIAGHFPPKGIFSLIERAGGDVCPEPSSLLLKRFDLAEKLLPA